MELHLIRHTEVSVEKGVCYGQSDVSLSERGLIALDEIVLDNDFHHIYSSPLKRCTKMLDVHSVDYLIDDRLKEMDFGTWELKLWDDIPVQEIKPWYIDFVHVRPPKGESLQIMAERVLSFLGELKEQNEGKKILCVTHAGVIRILWSYKEGVPLQEMFNLPVAFGQEIILNF